MPSTPRKSIWRSAITSASLGLLLAGAFGSSDVQAAPYKVDPAKSQLVVQVFKEGVASSLAHDHVIQATQISGTIEYDPASVTTSSIQVEAKSASLQADAPALRKQFGLTSELGEDDRKQVEANMKGEDQLNVGKYPTISFKSTGITVGTTPGDVLVKGNLTLRGVTKAVSFPAKIKMEGANFVGEGKLKIKQNDFGYEPYSALMGAIRNQNEVVLNLKVVGTP